jgi:hypothetical protein
MENPGKSVLKELYDDWIYEDMDHIKFIHTENKVFQRIRENNQDDWEMVELCREILFENEKLVDFLKKGIEDDRESIKKLS